MFGLTYVQFQWVSLGLIEFQFSFSSLYLLEIVLHGCNDNSQTLYTAQIVNKLYEFSTNDRIITLKI